MFDTKRGNEGWLDIAVKGKITIDTVLEGNLRFLAFLNTAKAIHMDKNSIDGLDLLPFTHMKRESILQNRFHFEPPHPTGSICIGVSLNLHHYVGDSIAITTRRITT